MPFKKNMILSLFILSVSAEKQYSNPGDILKAIGPAHYAGAAYCFSSYTASWNCGVHCKAKETIGTVLHTNVDNEVAGIFGTISYNPSYSLITVAFRGSLNVQNFLSNYIAFPVPISAIAPGKGFALAHSSFLADYLSVQSSVRQALRELTSKFPNYKIQFTGHSLGGPLSQLAAVDAYYSLNIRNIEQFSFNSPRVGNQAYVNLLQFPIYRYTQGPDIISREPPTGIGFMHPMVPEYWENNNVWYTCDAHESPDCNNSVLLPYFSLLVHLKSGSIIFQPVC